MADRPLPSAWWFLDEIVRPTLQESLDERSSLRRVLLAAVVIDHLADYICEHPFMHAYWMYPRNSVSQKPDYRKSRKGFMDKDQCFKTATEISNAFKHVVRRPLMSKSDNNGNTKQEHGIPSIFSLWLDGEVVKKGVYDPESTCYKSEIVQVYSIRFRDSKDDSAIHIGDVHEILQRAILFLEGELSQIQPRPSL